MRIRIRSAHGRSARQTRAVRAVVIALAAFGAAPATMAVAQTGAGVVDVRASATEAVQALLTLARHDAAARRKAETLSERVATDCAAGLDSCAAALSDVERAVRELTGARTHPGAPSQVPIAATGVYGQAGPRAEPVTCFLGVATGTPGWHQGNYYDIVYSGSILCPEGARGRVQIHITEVTLKEYPTGSPRSSLPQYGPFVIEHDPVHSPGGTTWGWYRRELLEHSTIKFQGYVEIVSGTTSSSVGWHIVPPGCTKLSRLLVRCDFESGPFSFLPISALEDPGYLADTGGYCDADVDDATIGRSAGPSSAPAPAAPAALPGLLGPNRARTVGADADRVAPAFVSKQRGFSIRAAPVRAEAGRAGSDGIVFGSNRDTAMRPIAAGGTGKLRHGVLRYGDAFAGADMIIRPSALGAQLAVANAAGRPLPAAARYRFHVGHQPGTSLVRLPSGIVVVLTGDRAPRLPATAPSLARLTGSGGPNALRDPKQQLALAEAALNDAARATGRRPAMVLVPHQGVRLRTEGDVVALTLEDPAQVALVQVVAPNDLVDDHDATEPSPGCFPAGPDEPEGVSEGSASAVIFPGVKCIGKVNKAFGVGGGGVEVRGQTVCVDGKRRSLSAKACLATKSWGISFLSSYADWRCPISDNVAFGTIVGQTNVFPCKPGNHKYKTHLYSKVNGMPSNGYQSGRLHIKKCG